MRVGILGPLEVSADGGPVAVGGARLRALLVRLAADPGRPVTAGSLAEAVWDGEEPPADPANAVQSLVSRLRRALPGVVGSDDRGYRLDLPPDAVDAARFERLAAEGGRALRAGDPVTAADLLGHALGLWRGRAFADAAAAPYAVVAAARLDELRLTATEDLIDAELARGEGAGQVAAARALAAAHPLRERTHLLLVKALAAAGGRAEALAAYEEFRVRLAGELGTDPGADLRETHLSLLRGEPIAAPPAAASRTDREAGAPGLQGGPAGDVRGRESAREGGQGRNVPVAGPHGVGESTRSPLAAPTGGRGNLRAPLTSFVGRADERKEIAAALEQTRLVTLLGPGGAGKTRLAGAVGSELAGRTPGGIWLAELAPVTDPDDVPRAVLGALSGPEVSFGDARGSESAQDVNTRLVAALSGPETLLVLDNCEHLLDAAARLAADLLGRCPALRVLATSRESLGLTGETLYRVPPLGLPGPGTDTVTALDFPAVRLFADRAAAVRPGFTVDDASLDAVVEICRRLDGLPLAIELAAARLRNLSAAQVAARLDDRFRLLTGGSRAALPRHRTLRAVVAWSWDLLDEQERRFAARLSVFRGGATPGSAAAVCGGPAEELLEALADKSLVQVTDYDEPRYAMLDTLREYAAERLEEAGGAAEPRRAHATYFRDLAETAEPYLRGREQLSWIARLTAERDNLTAALNRSVEAGDAATAVRLAAALATPWTVSGSHVDAVTRLNQALAVPGEAPERARAIALAARVVNSAAVSRGEEYRRQAAEALEAIRRVPFAERHPYMLLAEPFMAIFDDDMDRGVAAVEAGLAHPDPWTRAMLHALRSFIHENEGEAREQVEDLTIAANGFRELGDRWGLGTALQGLASELGETGDFTGALAALEESAGLMEEVGADDDVAQSRIWTALLRVRSGDVERGRRELTDLVDTGAGRATMRPFALLMLGDLERAEGELGKAAARYEAAERGLIPDTGTPPQLLAWARASRAYLCLAQGRPDQAAALVAEAIALATGEQDMPVVARTGVALADLLLHRGDPDAAAEVLGACDRLRGGPDLLNGDATRVAEGARAALGGAAYDAAHARGAALARPEVLQLLQVRRR